MLHQKGHQRLFSHRVVQHIPRRCHRHRQIVTAGDNRARSHQGQHRINPRPRYNLEYGTAGRPLSTGAQFYCPGKPGMYNRKRKTRDAIQRPLLLGQKPKVPCADQARRWSP